MNNHDPEAYLGCMIDCRLRIDIAARELQECPALPPEEDSIRSDLLSEILRSVDTATLQIRKSLETISFSGICAHRSTYESVRQSYEKDWKIALVLKTIENINPNGFPITIVENSLIDRSRVDISTGVKLDKATLLRLHGEISNNCHVKNPYSGDMDFGTLIPFLKRAKDFVIVSLSNHAIMLPDGVTMYRTTMRRFPDGKVEVAVLERESCDGWICRSTHVAG